LVNPIYVNPEGPVIGAVGEALDPEVSIAEAIDGLIPVLPIRKDGSEGRWQATARTLRKRIEQGRVRITGSADGGFTVSILKDGEYQKILDGEYVVTGRNPDGSLLVGDIDTDQVLAVPSTQWRVSSHDATQYGSRLLDTFIPGRKFPFPKSLYAVEDALRFFIGDKPGALVVDFFGGSATTTHAVARLNHQDGGHRRSFLITNNEVSDDEARRLRDAGYAPGDPEWEELGIFRNVTRPRVTAAITGRTPEGDRVKGDYKFSDEFPMEEGLDENVEFFRLDYLDAIEVELGRCFGEILPTLWLSAGGRGTRQGIDADANYSLASDGPYAVLVRPSGVEGLLSVLSSRPDVTHVFVVTDSEDAFSELAEQLPPTLTVRMLPRDYLHSFSNGREALG
jgi:adenine-specific DNA-methyltransferase